VTELLARTSTPGGGRARPERGRALALVGVGLLGAAGLAYVGVRNPHDPGVAMPTCPVHWLTGLDCPGCGGLRMTHDLLHGDVTAAFVDNALLLVLAPLLLFLLARAGYRWVLHRPRPAAGRFELSGRLGVALTAAAFTWMLVRNLAGW
jgi:hypothetical protein